jgi:3D (Asp-Asp-Asp) domain-containing protein
MMNNMFAQCVVSCLLAWQGTTDTALVYGYSSEVSQTDSSPFITASGSRVNERTLANNCLPFGTAILLDDEVYVVDDRMAKRYGCEVFDRWFGSRSEAISWGVRSKEIIILR